jgi:hypothetical protein
MPGPAHHPKSPSMTSRHTPTDPPQAAICARFVAGPQPPEGHETLGIALATIESRPLHGVRHAIEHGTCGWYVWGGEMSDREDFFQPLCVDHLERRCPIIVPYLALPPGWRFLLAPDHEDVWFDPEVLNAC